MVSNTESWCNETANGNFLSNQENYYSVHQPRKYKKGDTICVYIHKQLELKLRNYVDIFNDEIETCSVEFLSSRSKSFTVPGIYRPPKRYTKVFWNYYKKFF